MFIPKSGCIIQRITSHPIFTMAECRRLQRKTSTMPSSYLTTCEMLKAPCETTQGAICKAIEVDASSQLYLNKMAAKSPLAHLHLTHVKNTAFTLGGISLKRSQLQIKRLPRSSH
mmetsp:Transcript_36591/g.88201  ORF Transcript_36591/g.88201 Transcript_36591/m.88201 type:complete len:115 (+) Transcript_36591:553-897(+)